MGPLSVIDVGVTGFSTNMSRVTRSVRKKPYRWYKAPEPFRWYLGTMSLLVPAGVMGFALSWALDGGYSFLPSGNADNGSLVEVGMGFGGAAPLITFGHSLVAVALVANLPQLVLTVIYICCNDLMSSMLLVHEYHQFATLRKTLRVTRRKGQQRSTHFLSLPFRWSVPLLVVWTALHFFTSDTMYLTRVDIHDHYGMLDTRRSFTALTLSADWALWVCVLIGVMLFIVVMLGITKLKRGIPLARTNSLAISAACHPGPDDTDAALLPVMYGVLEGSQNNGVECVGFSSKPARALEPEVMYSSYGEIARGEEVWRVGRSSGMSPVENGGDEGIELLRRTSMHVQPVPTKKTVTSDENTDLGVM